MAASSAEVINLLFISDSETSKYNNKLFLCRPSYLTTFACSSYDYDLNVHQFSSDVPCD